MKSLKLLSGMLFILCSFFALDASAVTIQQSVPCTWATTYINSPGGNYGADVVSVCTSTTLGQIAIKSSHYGPGPTCSLSTSYKYTGTCESPSFYQEVQACSVYSGSVYGTVYTDMYHPFPTSSVNSYCGPCGYTTTVLDHSNTGATLKVVCK